MHATLTYPTQLGGRFFRKSSVRVYRFGFNGKEKVDEVYGHDNAYDFGARLYDPRLGRWLAVDPLFAKYPDLSPYNFVANMPTIAIDPDGKDIIIKYRDENGKKQKYKYTPGVGYLGDNPFVQSAVTALDFLVSEKNKTSDQITQIANDNGIRLYIQYQAPGASPRTHPNNNNEVTIFWNPYTGLQPLDMDGNPESAPNSPARNKAHEIKHAHNWLYGRIDYLKRMRDEFGSLKKDVENNYLRYGNAEEKKVIEEINGEVSPLEGKRSSVFGAPVIYNGPLPSDGLSADDTNTAKSIENAKKKMPSDKTPNNE